MCEARWLQNHHATEFHCQTCGRYAFEAEADLVMGGLWEFLTDARARQDARVLKLLPALQRSIAAATASGEMQLLTFETWEAEAREFLDGGGSPR
jgi:hypothetical protein